MQPTEVDERWKEWATPKQAEAIDAVLKHGTVCAAAKDAYSSRHGYAAPRSADTITYHREYGQCWSATTSPEMVA